MVIDTSVPHGDKITWKSDDPVWVNLWPLTSDKIAAALVLVQEQFAAGHIEPTSSPWNEYSHICYKEKAWKMEDITRP